MFTSATSAQAHFAGTRQLRQGRASRDGKAMLSFLAASGFCLAFSLVYSLFSHGVSSPWMSGLALFPLLLGTVPYGAMALAGTHPLDRVGFNAYNSAVAAATAGSCVLGILQIADATSRAMWVFPAVSAVCCIIAAASVIRQR